MKAQKNKIKSGTRKPIRRFVYMVLLFLLLVGLPIVVYKDYQRRESERVKKEIARQENLQNISVGITAGQDIAADWQVFKNDQYDFTIKYPTDWEYVQEMPAGPGAKYKLKVSFWYKLATKNNMKGVDVYVYEGNEFSNLALTDAVIRKNPNASPQTLNQFSDVTIGEKNYPAKEVYILNNSAFFKNTYFYSLTKDNYTYTIVPTLGKGVSSGLVYDGKKEVALYLPEFFDMLSTFEFNEIVPNPIENKISIPHRVYISKPMCANKNDHPQYSKQHKGLHMDEDCCMDPDEWPNPRCAYSAKGMSVTTHRAP